MKTRTVVFHLFFLVVVSVQLYSSWSGERIFEYIAKPFILFLIAVYFLLHTRPAPYRWVVLLAFAFSWLGDLILMFAWKNDLFFYAGVGGFFLSQVFYIIAFLKYNTKSGKGIVFRKPLWLIPFFAYLAGIYMLIYPGLEGVMKPVVLFYAISLTGMAISAFNRKGLTSNPAFWLIFAGSIFFLLSDSLLAYNRFLTEIPKGGFIIMSTYIAAQYLIMRGLMRDEMGQGDKGGQMAQTGL